MQYQNIKSDNEAASMWEEMPETNVPEVLKAMEIGEMKTGYFVPLKRVASIRVQLTNIKTYSDRVFTSEQVEGGVVIWRTA